MKRAALQGDFAIGAAGFLCYLRDLFTAAGKDVFTREDILVVLEQCSIDPALFPDGIGIKMWDMPGLEDFENVD